MRWLAKNIRTFLLALILGIAVWISAVTASDPNEVRVYPNPIPLEVIGNDPSLVITGQIPTTVEVTIRAPRSAWEQLTAQEGSVQATLDLSGLSAGEHQVNVQIRVIDKARPYQIVLTNPASVTVKLEPLATRTLPILLSLSGTPAIGYQAGEVTYVPTEVTISGPASLVNMAVRARVLVNLDGTRENIDQSNPIQIIDAENTVIRGLTTTPDSARVTVPVSQQGGFRDVAVKVVVQGQIASGYRLENITVFPPVVTLYAADPQLIKDIPGVVETEPLNLQDAQENISTRLTLNLPANVTVVGGSEKVQVTVNISPIQTSLTLLNQPINVTGLPEGLAAQVLPQTVDVIISGPLPVLDALTAKDIVVNVDVGGLEPGTHQLTPQVEVLVSNVRVESILPGTVEVILFVPNTPTPTAGP